MKIICTGLFLIICNFLCHAQKIKIIETKENIGGGSNNALFVFIPEVDYKLVEKEWKNFIKKFDAKVSSNGDEIFADNALIKDIGPNTIDVYLKLIQDENGSKFYASFDLGGSFLSSSQHGPQYKVAENLIREFAIRLAKEAVSQQLKEAEKEQEKLEKKQSNLEKEKENLQKNIEKFKEQIKNAENEIVQNIKNQELNKQTMEIQKKVVDAIKLKGQKID